MILSHNKTKAKTVTITIIFGELKLQLNLKLTDVGLTDVKKTNKN